MSAIREILSDDSGNLSSMRIAFLLWTLALSIVIVVVGIAKMKLPEVPWEYVILTGLFAGGKVAQKQIEEHEGKNAVSGS